jgi:glycosyltransferase involved in cell wall biosynthesis
VSGSSLSVVVPTFNRCDSLRKTLAGLARQTYPSSLFEVVIVSDGSTDGTRKMVEEFACSAQFTILFIEQANGGPSRARNRAIQESSNDVVVFIDDDVEPVPQFLESHAKWHDNDRHVAIIGPLLPDPIYQEIEPAWITWEHAKLKRVYEMFQPDGPFKEGQGGPTHFYTGNASIRRDWLNELGGFDLRYTRQEDVELATRLAKSFGIRFIFDFNAVGLHRPSRTFDSWLKIPREYGRLDADRIADGTITIEDIHWNFKNRHIFSRLFASIAGISKVSSIAVNSLLKAASLSASAMRMKPLALICLSGLYNVTYLTAFNAERTAVSVARLPVDRGGGSSLGSIL